jgi:hypothetical protein
VEQASQPPSPEVAHAAFMVNTSDLLPCGPDDHMTGVIDRTDTLGPGGPGRMDEDGEGGGTWSDRWVVSGFRKAGQEFLGSYTFQHTPACLNEDGEGRGTWSDRWGGWVIHIAVVGVKLHKTRILWQLRILANACVQQLLNVHGMPTRRLC